MMRYKNETWKKPKHAILDCFHYTHHTHHTPHIPHIQYNGISLLLVGVGSPFLAHIILCCVTEVKTTNGQLKWVLSREVHPVIKQGRGQIVLFQGEVRK